MSTRKRRPVRSLVTLIVAMLAAMAALVIGNTAKGTPLVPSLALDLQGGTQLILRPTSTRADERAITEGDLNQAVSIIRNRIDASGVSESEITSMGSEDIVVSIPGTPSQETLDLIRSSSQMNFQPVLQIGVARTSAAALKQAEANASGNGAQPKAQSGDEASQSDPSAQDSARSAQSGESADSAQSDEMISTALDETNAMTLADRSQDGILSDTPESEPENASSLAWMTEQALFDFYTLDYTAQASDQGGPADKPFAACDENGSIKYILGPVTVTGANLDTTSTGQIANSTGQTTGQWGVDLQFDSEGTQAFAESSKILYSFHDQGPEGKSLMSTPNRNHFAVVLDGTVITAPSMSAIISDDRARISGSFTARSTSALADQLSFGSLPLNFRVQSEQHISTTLGSDHLEKGLLAGLIDLLLVIVYLIWQYRGLAIISGGSLVVAAVATYLVITLLSGGIEYRLSLAGVAGLIMAVGVTADSFIVYFERVRDEVRDRHPLQAAVDEGWDRAKRTIVVSDVVNIVATVILYLLAVGGVQGFAFTLGVTTVIDLFVIFVFAHPMMELLIATRFFGEGHPLSGLDPEHLGAKNGLMYAGRGRMVSRGSLDSSGSSSASSKGSEADASIAARRRQGRLARQEALKTKGGVSATDTQGGKR